MRYVAWVPLLCAAYCFYRVTKGLRTGSTWGFSADDWDPAVVHYDRATDGFSFWLTLILHAIFGVGFIHLSMKLFHVW